MKFKCPNCNKEIISENRARSKDTIIKSRVVFLNDDGKVLCRCINCKKVVGLPLNFNNQKIEKK